MRSCSTVKTPASCATLFAQFLQAHDTIIQQAALIALLAHQVQGFGKPKLSTQWQIDVISTSRAPWAPLVLPNSEPPRFAADFPCGPVGRRSGNATKPAAATVPSCSHRFPSSSRPWNAWFGPHCVAHCSSRRYPQRYPPGACPSDPGTAARKARTSRYTCAALQRRECQTPGLSPDPLNPVMTTSCFKGRSRSNPFRLFWRTPLRAIRTLTSRCRQLADIARG